MDNEQRLGDAFNVKRDPTQTEYVVHLLVKGEQGASEGGSAHRRAVSTPPAQTPDGRQQQAQAQIPFQQAMNAQRHPLPNIGPQFHPGQPPFPQIIARNQQMRAGMGMQGIGQPGQGQPQGGGQVGPNAGTGQTGQQPQQSGPNEGLGQNGQQQQQGQHQHVPGRPISGQGFHMQGVGPNGQRFHIHQQMMQFPGMAMPGGQMPFGFPGMPQAPGMMPGMANHGPTPGMPQQNNGPTALDRARENMAEMRRMVDEMRNENDASEEQQRRIADIQRRAQSLNEYIDPLNLGNANTVPNAQRAAPANPAIAGNRTSLPQPFQGGLPPLYNAPRRPAIPIPQAQHVHPPSNPNDVTAYLLSGPQGPQALLFSPQHGAYTGTLALNARPQPTPTAAASHNSITTQQNLQQPQPQEQQDPVAAAAARAAAELQLRHQNAAAGGAQQDPMQALLGHFWLLMRIMIFAWFLLGSNMGWQRPLLLMAIGAGFWAVRAGVLGDGAAVRRWWEGVVGVEGLRREGERAQGAQRQARDQQREGQAPQPGQAPARGQESGAQRNAMPTPEQVAQRLLNEQRERNAQQNAWWRERIRPVERAVALFVASLWPGVGEATVRARREMEERLRAEEETERRRQEEEAAAAGDEEGNLEDGEGKKGGDGREDEGQAAETVGGEKGEGSAVASATGRADADGDGLRERRTGGESVQFGTSGSAGDSSS